MIKIPVEVTILHEAIDQSFDPRFLQVAQRPEEWRPISLDPALDWSFKESDEPGLADWKRGARDGLQDGDGVRWCSDGTLAWRPLLSSARFRSIFAPTSADVACVAARIESFAEMGGELGVATAVTFRVRHHPVDTDLGALGGIIEHVLQPRPGIRLDREELETWQPVAFLSMPFLLPVKDTG
jgi:hypothetical protein